ncbi:enoyl-CoA hydratase-related protein [Yoonia sp. SS1-5]|uniref:Enoyl-CoA hydratase-related protein n=1 Tax=Yoonia rhodophyticola TaxID=3137370 RepID=A0AAN0NIX7_9RHOB
MSDAFEISHSAQIAHLKFTRADKSNAMAHAFWSDFHPAIAELNRDGQTRVLVISGEGRHFCSGMDVSMFMGDTPKTVTPDDREAFVEVVRTMQIAISALEEARFPVIAAVQGACLGAGFDLAAACDLRFASRDAKFRIEETNIGMMADLGVLQRLPRLVPEGIAREMAYLGKSLPAEEAHRFGLVNGLAEDAAGALDLAMAAAKQITLKAPLAIAGSKASITYARSHSTQESLAHTCLLQSALWKPEDIMTAFGARTQKKDAEFQPLKALAKFP